MFVTLLMASVAAVHVDVSVDTTSTSAFEHTWKKSWGSGHAALTLRDDWRKHLKLAVNDMGLQGVRYHGIFDDDQGPVVSAPGVYNFTLIDSTWDFLVANGVKPIVEFSFMPAWIAGCSWTGKVGGPTSSNPTITVNPNAPKCRGQTMKYKGITQPPADYNAWYSLVKATLEHAVQRYGIAEVRSWSFEVWNELWGMPFPSEYMQLYNASARAVKAVDSQLKVGGPATAQLENVAAFAQACTDSKIPYDFVSTHHYPSDPQCPHGKDWDPDCFTTNVLKSRHSVPASTPFYLTEYNVGCCLGYKQHDTPAAAAFVFRQVGKLSQHLDVMSYWAFTDVFEEGGFPTIEFENIYGSMTKDGVPKPVWRAFQLMHTHAGNLGVNTTVSQRHAAVAAAAVEVVQQMPLDTCALVPKTDFLQGDILPESQKMYTDTAEECCTACQQHTGTSPDTKCQLWSWGNASSSCCPKRCYLKQLAGARQTNDKDFTSGYAGTAPPPPPPPGVKPQVSAFATMNSTGSTSAATVPSSDGLLASLRVFLGYWGNPQQDQSNPPGNRTVTLTIKHAAGTTLPATASIYQIGGGYTEPYAAWVGMGSPPQPTASQLATLMKASEIGVVAPAAVTPSGATTATVTIGMVENSAVVVAFS